MADFGEFNLSFTWVIRSFCHLNMATLAWLKGKPLTDSEGRYTFLPTVKKRHRHPHMKSCAQSSCHKIASIILLFRLLQEVNI